MLGILDNDKKSNLNNADSPKSSPLSSYNLHSPYKLRMAQATISDINTNERLSI